MVPKPFVFQKALRPRFRAVLFRMVPKLVEKLPAKPLSFRAVLFRMVPKPFLKA